MSVRDVFVHYFERTARMVGHGMIHPRLRPVVKSFVFGPAGTEKVVFSVVHAAYATAPERPVRMFDTVFHITGFHVRSSPYIAAEAACGVGHRQDAVNEGSAAH